MAKRDVTEYCYTMLQQYIELQNDLKDFEQAFRDGHITEERLAEVKFDVERVKENYDRLVYIQYLYDLPNRPKKKEKFKKANKDIEQYFDEKNASSATVFEENKSIIGKIKAELKTITEEDKAGK